MLSSAQILLWREASEDCVVWGRDWRSVKASTGTDAAGSEANVEARLETGGQAAQPRGVSAEREGGSAAAVGCFVRGRSTQ